jgi:hypothetical protein
MGHQIPRFGAIAHFFLDGGFHLFTKRIGTLKGATGHFGHIVKKVLVHERILCYGALIL